MRRRCWPRCASVMPATWAGRMRPCGRPTDALVIDTCALGIDEAVRAAHCGGASLRQTGAADAGIPTWRRKAVL